jgi:hypothetical protein
MKFFYNGVEKILFITLRLTIAWRWMSLRKRRQLEIGGQSPIGWLLKPVPVVATQLTHVVSLEILSTLPFVILVKIWQIKKFQIQSISLI